MPGRGAGEESWLVFNVSYRRCLFRFWKPEVVWQACGQVGLAGGAGVFGLRAGAEALRGGGGEGQRVLSLKRFLCSSLSQLK